MLSCTSSGSSVESFSTPLKLVEKDNSTGEYIVKMSPQDFDQLSNQGCVVPTTERFVKYYVLISETVIIVEQYMLNIQIKYSKHSQMKHISF